MKPAGAYIGVGEPETVLNVGVSGPGVVRSALERLGPEADLLSVAETVKRTAFKVTRMGELVGREASHAAWLLVQHADAAPDFQSAVLDPAGAFPWMLSNAVVDVVR